MSGTRGRIPPADLAAMAAAIETDCERVDAGLGFGR